MTGIYLITNTINGKCYVGQSVDIERRWKAHQCCKDKTPLYNAIRKYDECHFKWEVLIECSEESLDFFERAFIIGYNCISPDGYNLKSGGANGRPSDETRKKLSEANKGKPKAPFSEEHKCHIGEAQKGKTKAPRSEETKQKLSAANKGKTVSEETKAKMSEAQRLRRAAKCTNEEEQNVF